MPTFMILMRLTDKGAAEIKDQPDSVNRSIKAFEEMGGKVIGVYACGAIYDFVGIGEAPNGKVAEAFRRYILAAGLARAQVIRLYPLAEFQAIIDSLKLK